MNDLMKILKTAVVKREAYADSLETTESIRAYDEFRGAYLRIRDFPYYRYSARDFEAYKSYIINNLGMRYDTAVELFTTDPALIPSYFTATDAATILENKRLDYIGRYLCYYPYYDLPTDLSIFELSTEDFEIYKSDDGYSKYNSIEVESMVLDPSLARTILSEDDYSIMMSVKMKEYFGTYLEMNPYYMELMGIPSSKDDYIMLDATTVTKLGSSVDVTKPLHLMNASEVSILKSTGILRYAIDSYPELGYLRYLDKRIPFYQAREARTYGLVYINDNINTALAALYRQSFENQRRFFMTTQYASIMEIQTYQELNISMMLALSALVMSAQECAVTSDVSLLDDVYLDLLFREFGVPAWDLPRYLKTRLVERLKDLISYKGSTRVITDIANLFNLMNVDKLIFFKEESIAGQTRVRYIKMPIGEFDFVEAIKNNKSYDISDLTSKDDRWGTGAGDKLISELNSRDFTYYPSKYISVENAIELCKQSLDTTLFFSHATNPAHTELVDLKFRHKLGGIELNLYEAVTYLYSLTFLKHGFDAKILTEFSQLVTIGIRKQDDYETLTRAFRMEYYNDDSAIASVSDLGKTYDLKSPEIWKFMDELASNVSAIHTIKTLLSTVVEKEQYRILRELMKALSYIETIKDKPGRYQLIPDGCRTYPDILANKNPELSARYLLYKETAAVSQDRMIEEVSAEIAYVCDMLQEYCNQYNNPKHQLALTELANYKELEFDTVKAYLSSIITFFMSYTVDVTDFSTVFLFDDRQANRFGILEETNFAMTAKEIDAMQVRNRPSSDKYVIDKIIGQREKIRVKEYFFPNNTNRR